MYLLIEYACKATMQPMLAMFKSVFEITFYVF